MKPAGQHIAQLNGPMLISGHTVPAIHYDISVWSMQPWLFHISLLLYATKTPHSLMAELSIHTSHTVCKAIYERSMFSYLSMISSIWDFRFIPLS